MSGLYIHIPFCKQACHYCNFHFSTVQKHKPQLLEAMTKEIVMKSFQKPRPLETVYFGGGTPSVFTPSELAQLLEAVNKKHHLLADAEITLEANPDDLNMSYLKDLQAMGFNRISVGVQSFHDHELKMMNRAHNTQQAKEALALVADGFSNWSLDLMFGMPQSTDQSWAENLEQAMHYHPPHLSAYALTIEPRTVLEKYIDKGFITPCSEEQVVSQFEQLVAYTTSVGYENYEVNSFSKPGMYSRNNTGYWTGKPYIGIGPSAHGFEGTRRAWNVSNNAQYIRALRNNTLAETEETLTPIDRFNECVMTGLRTQWGVSLDEVHRNFGKRYKDHLIQEIQPQIVAGNIRLEEGVIYTTKKGRFLADGIAASLFLVNLS
ncbi:MAG: radical SAM family heme chaperone HemW [Flavobacteriaceae bacterium]